MILRAERQYIAAVEPAQMESWTAAMDRNLELWVENLDRTSVLELDEGGRQAAGFMMWRPEPDGGATLITIQVLPQFRRRGLGLVLLEAFATQATAAGATVLRLGVHENNPAREIYPRVGYVHVGRSGDYIEYELPV